MIKNKMRNINFINRTVYVYKKKDIDVKCGYEKNIN